jgi:3-oxoacyl-[acyl-carrier protein] reductase
MSIVIDFSGKTALVTGGGTGLGRQTAIRLAEAGAKVILASNDLPSIEETAEEIRAAGGYALPVETDVSKPDSVNRMIEQAKTHVGGVDILINNAAIYPSKPFEEVSVEEWDEVFGVNARGGFLCAKAVVPHMKEMRWGRIINISSITFFVPFDNLIHYVATKGAAVGFTRALAKEVGEYGITVNSIAPGAFPDKGGGDSSRPGRVQPQNPRCSMPETKGHARGSGQCCAVFLQRFERVCHRPNHAGGRRMVRTLTAST